MSKLWQYFWCPYDIMRLPATLTHSANSHDLLEVHQSAGLSRADQSSRLDLAETFVTERESVLVKHETN